MAALSTYLENKIIDHINGKTSFTMPANVYIALCTTTPTAGTAGTEAAYTGYTRSTVAIAAGMAAASSGSSTNSGAAISFPACTAGSSTVVAFQAYDATTAGNPLFFGACSLSISAGITPSFATSQLTVSIT